MPVALVRILLAAGVMVALLPAYFLFGPGEFVRPTMGQVGWLLVSGVMGIVIGDSLTYESLVTLGPRRTTQLYTLQPVAAVTAGYALGESLGAGMLLGIGVVIVATAAAIFARPAEDDDATGEPGRLTKLGLAYGIGGALFRGLGAVAGREAFRTAGPALDPFFATTIRVVGATAVVWVLPIVRGNVRETIGILKAPGVARRVWAGTIVGPIIGMVCYVSALKNAPAGLVATIVSTSPLLVLPYVTVKYHAKLGVVTPVAAAVACGGVAVISDPGIVVRVMQALHALRVM
jgi:drug/metabolite transporter (DMT)-like permease